MTTPTDLHCVRYEIHGAVALITLNRPERMNTFGSTMKADLAHAFFELARKDESVRAVVVTGSGDRAFSAGADIKERAQSDASATDFFVAQRDVYALFSGVRTFEKPVVAAVNGVAIGGGMELALACDIRLAATTARFGLTELKLGVLPAAGGTQLLPRLIGVGRAKEMLMSSDIVDADTALRYGIVTRLYEPDALLQAALDYAQRLAEQPPLAIRMAKLIVDEGSATDLKTALEIERLAATVVYGSADRAEGLRAFVEKRKPMFVGR